MANTNNNDQVNIVIVYRVSEQAVFPSKLPSGYMLSSPKTMTLPAWRGIIDVPTDLTIIIPNGVLFQTAPIPGISWQTRRSIAEKLFTPCTTPQRVSLIMSNDTDTDIIINVGDPIGQLKILGNIKPELVEATTQLD